MSWYSLSLSTSSVGAHRYTTRHAAAPLWDFCVPCVHIRLGALFRAFNRFRGGSYTAHYQAVTTAQSQCPDGVGSMGYVEVAGHDYSESDYYSTSIISKNISRVCSSSSFLVSSWKPFLR